MSDSSQSLQIRTSDGIVYNVSVAVAQQMGLTQSWLQQERGLSSSDEHIAAEVKAVEPVEEDDDANIMPLDRVSSPTFQLVLKWCHTVQSLDNISEAIDKDIRSSILKSILSEVNASDSDIFELIIAADFLHIEGLLEAGTQYVADLINQCESVEAIRKRFHIAHDSDDDEEWME